MRVTRKWTKHKVIAIDGKFLKHWRKIRGLTQAQLAGLLTVSKRTLEGWEAGRPIRQPQMLALALRSITVDKDRRK